MDEYCRVLIIDDEFIMRQGMKHMLEWEKEGFQIVGEASNGQEGLVLVEELRPHIVLADIVMPIIDGMEFSEIMGKRFPYIQLIILSSYDKFEYVKATLLSGAVDYILKPALNPDILLDTLKRAAGRIPGMKLENRKEVPYASQIEKFLLGFKEKLDEVTFAGYFSHTLFRLLALNVRETAGYKKEVMVSVQQRAEAYFADTGSCVALPVFLDEGILCVVLNYRLKDETSVMADAEAIAGRLKRIYPRAFWVMSRSFTNIQDMRRHYEQEVKSQMCHAFYYPGRHLLVAEEFRESKVVVRFEFEAYTRMLSQRRYVEALELFREYMDYLLEMRMEEEKLKNLSRNLLFNFLIELEELSVDSDALKDRYFSMLEQTLCADEFRDAVEVIVSELHGILKQNSGMEDERIMRMKQYVASHYKEPLELSDIAKQFGLSYHYLSTYFSQMAKEGFSEYLNKLRIEHAMALLREGEGSISEIGCTVGYADHSYFCRVFKKITGETPSSFRRREKLRGR